MHALLLLNCCNLLHYTVIYSTLYITTGKNVYMPELNLK